MRNQLLLSTIGAAFAIAASFEGDARACGGCFHPPSQSGTVVTDHRMIFSVSPLTTTLYDEIEYQGSPSSFAWVLPIHGPVRVELSSDLVFGTLDQVTQTTIVAPPYPCSCSCGRVFPGNTPPPAAPVSGGGGGGTVTVIAQQVVGPYDTVQLKSTDPRALEAWLVANGYAIPTDVQPVIAAYVKDGFDFLAMRLAPGQGVRAMRPVSVTTAGAGLSLPLRMVAAGTGATVGITLWVVGSGRYEPQNFKMFTISPSDLVWDWLASISNYTTLRANDEASLGNAAWQIESSLDIGPYQVQTSVVNGPAAPDYTAIPSSDAGPGETAEQVRAADLATLFPLGNSTVRVTRMRADLSRAALANDLVLQASADQSTLPNTYQAVQSINAPKCPATCPCGGGSSGGSSGGFSGSSSGVSGGSSGGQLGSSSGSPADADGGTGAAASPPHESFGCATSPAESRGTGLEITLACLAGAAMLGARSRRKR